MASQLLPLGTFTVNSRHKTTLTARRTHRQMRRLEDLGRHERR